MELQLLLPLVRGAAWCLEQLRCLELHQLLCPEELWCLEQLLCLELHQLRCPEEQVRCPEAGGWRLERARGLQQLGLLQHLLELANVVDGRLLSVAP